VIPTLCEGCGRTADDREVFCADCGRDLPGRSVQPSEAAPPGWLVASGRGEAASLFEPLPSVPLLSRDPQVARAAWPGRARARTAAAEPPAAAAAGAAITVASAAAAGAPALTVAADGPAAQPATEVELAGASVAPLPPTLPAADGPGAVVAERPPLRALYFPLLAVAVLSSIAAVVLLVLHVVRGG
jgi:hypothetical protein